MSPLATKWRLFKKKNPHEKGINRLHKSMSQIPNAVSARVYTVVRRDLRWDKAGIMGWAILNKVLLDCDHSNHWITQIRTDDCR